LGSIVWVPCKFDEKHTFNCESNDGLDLSQHVNSCNRQLICLMMHRGIAAKCLSHQYWSMCTKTPKLCCWTRPKYAIALIPSCRRCSWHCTLHTVAVCSFDLSPKTWATRSAWIKNKTTPMSL
jgi:hypothetical protein